MFLTVFLRVLFFAICTNLPEHIIYVYQQVNTEQRSHCRPCMHLVGENISGDRVDELAVVHDQLN